MASKYTPNKWELYDPDVLDDDQPDAFITLEKLENMENGIEEANIPLEIGDVSVGDNYDINITEDSENKIKKLNITFPNSGKGDPGEDGKSAYEIWIEAGNCGTEQEFLDSLKGEDGLNGNDGQSAYELWKLQPGNENKSITEFFESLKGEQGPPGGTIEFVDF